MATAISKYLDVTGTFAVESLRTATIIQANLDVDVNSFMFLAVAFRE